MSFPKPRKEQPPVTKTPSHVTPAKTDGEMQSRPMASGPTAHQGRQLEVQVLSPWGAILARQRQAQNVTRARETRRGITADPALPAAEVVFSTGELPPSSPTGRLPADGDQKATHSSLNQNSVKAPPKRRSRRTAAAGPPLEAEAVEAASQRLADLVMRTAGNQAAVACLGPVLPAIMAGMVRGAALDGRAGFSDRSMLAKMMGMPWATGSEQQRGTKTAAVELGARLERALNRNTAALRGGPYHGPIVDVEPDGPAEVTADQAGAKE
jgi:hypothetical protein